MTLEWMPYLETAQEAARAAGRVALAAWDRPLHSSLKGFRDLVTEVDLKCQEIIKAMVASRFPNHGFLAEEADQTGNPDAEYRWIIDPIDGTTNYAHHFPHFSISIALARRDQVLAGAVYDPPRDHMFSAVRGQGARLNDRPIHVSRCDSLDAAVLAVEWAREVEPRRLSLRLLSRIGAEVLTIRSPGSAALSLSYVAAGWTDLYFNLRLAPWDVAAGGLIVEEAGGRLTDLAGLPWSVHGSAYLATNGLLHPAALEMLRPDGLAQ